MLQSGLIGRGKAFGQSIRRVAGDFIDLIVGDHDSVVAVAGLDGA
jgi:hypothetical protein